MGSGAGESVENVRKAVEILKERNVDFAFDGEMQADAALVPEVGEHKLPARPLPAMPTSSSSRTSMLLISVTRWFSALPMQRLSDLWFRALTNYP